MNAVDTQPSSIAVCTLWEKDFHKGVGTLVNSLVQAGFKGTVWAGYRGDLPAWANAGISHGDTHLVNTGAGVEIAFLKLTTPIHLAHYKPDFMKHVLIERAPNAEGIFYMDPDIFVLGPWSFFEQWIRFGIAACEDVSYPLNPTHPVVQMWKEYACKIGYTEWKFSGASLNSGLVGLMRTHLSFLELWQELLLAVTRDYNLSGHLKSFSRTDIFQIPDQDAFTMAASLSPCPISWVGPDGMAFERGEWLTLHAYSPKPWRRRVFRDLIVEGHRPDSALRLYWKLAGAPLAIESQARIRLHRWFLPLTALLGRFYSRGG